MGKVTWLLSPLSTAVFRTPEIIRRMGTSLSAVISGIVWVDKKLVMIGQWYSRQPFTNHNERLSNQTILKTVAPEACIHSP